VRLGRAVRLGTALIVATSALAATTIATTAPANAAVRKVPYLMGAVAYGTNILSDTVGASSGPTAYSSIGCAHQVPLVYKNNVAGVQNNPAVTVGAVTSTTTATKDAAGDTVATAVSKVASVNVGNSTMALTINALTGTSKAWATKAGVFHAASTLNIGDMSLTQSGTPVGGSLGDLLNGPVSTIISTLKKGPITIPNFAELRLGGTGQATSARAAKSGTIALRVLVFGQDGAAGGGDDTKVVVGRSVAQISKYTDPGIFGGEAHATELSLLNGVATGGRNVLQPLPCAGTGGVIVKHSAAAVNLGGLNQLVIGAAEADAYARRGTPAGGSTAWTAGRVASVNLGGGQLKINGIAAVAKVVRDSHGRLHRSWSQTIGSITASGTPHAVPAPGQTLEIPGVARIEVPKATLTTTGEQVTALRLTLLNGTAATSVINLGNAKVGSHN
jgi:hypothetical protein